MAASDPNPASSVGKPTARLRAHVEQIAGGACILIHWTRGRRAHAVPALLEIEVPEIRGLVSYATALHELGHILGRYQTSRSTMTRERWAWAWARQHALVWTPAMERSAQASLAWYQARAPWPVLALEDCLPPGCHLE